MLILTARMIGKKPVEMVLAFFIFVVVQLLIVHKSFAISSTKTKNGTGASHFLMDKSLRLNYYEYRRTNFFCPKFAPGHLDEGNK